MIYTHRYTTYSLSPAVCLGCYPFLFSVKGAHVLNLNLHNAEYTEHKSIKMKSLPCLIGHTVVLGEFSKKHSLTSQGPLNSKGCYMYIMLVLVIKLNNCFIIYPLLQK